MAEKKDTFIYSEEIRKLKNNSPSRLYLLYGQEEYLKGLFAAEIRKMLFPDGDDGFSYKLFSDSDFDVADIAEAVDSVPFLSNATLVEIRGFDINRYGEQLLSFLTDIPEYCTVLFIQNSDYTPDFRLKVNKYFRDHYSVFNISIQGQGELVRWIRKRFASEGKKIDREASEQLIFLSGSSMTGLIPEIKKISSSLVSDTVTINDVRSFAHRLPEADVFEMVECLTLGKTKSAVEKLSDLIESRSADPVQLLSVIGIQYKRLYASALARKHGKGADWLVACDAVKYDWIARKMLNMSSHYTIKQLENILMMLSDADYKMKTGADDNGELLIDVLIFLTSGAVNDQNS